MASDERVKNAKEAAGRAGEAANDATATVKSTASQATENMRDFAARASSAAGDLYSDANAKVRDAVDRIPEASEALQAGRKAYERGNRTLGPHVAKQPLEALLLAGAIGYLVGWATNRG